jgi:splicing factor U2AF 35 kDa subunit
MHLKKISSKFKKSLFKQMYEEHPEYRERKSRSKSRNHSKGKKDKKSKKDGTARKRENSQQSSRYNSEERMRMIEEWNQQVGLGKHEDQNNQMYYRSSPELVQLNH